MCHFLRASRRLLGVHSVRRRKSRSTPGLPQLGGRAVAPIGQGPGLAAALLFRQRVHKRPRGTDSRQSRSHQDGGHPDSGRPGAARATWLYSRPLEQRSCICGNAHRRTGSHLGRSDVNWGHLGSLSRGKYVSHGQDHRWSDRRTWYRIHSCGLTVGRPWCGPVHRCHCASRDGNRSGTLDLASGAEQTKPCDGYTAVGHGHRHRGSKGHQRRLGAHRRATPPGRRGWDSPRRAHRRRKRRR